MRVYVGGPTYPKELRVQSKKTSKPYLETLYEEPQVHPFEVRENDRAYYSTIPMAQSAVMIASTWRIGLMQSSKSYPGCPRLYEMSSHHTRQRRTIRAA
ncbi:hypothetical protein BHE74_00024260 [Ensete ventricosum]|nr:hypothetical protein BHE74_00024260 [Ensete ventricosum]